MALSGSSLGKKSAIAELTQRLTFLFLALLVFRFGAHIPIPGLDPHRLVDFFQKHEQNSVLGFLNLFSGGALKGLTIFSLGVMPYISASIIVQLFSTMMPSLQRLRKEGESGQRKMNQYTRYFTLVLALFQGVGMSRFLAGTGVALVSGLSFYCVATLTLVTGTMFLMWLGEQVSERGIGNGVSMVIFAGIVAHLPDAMGQSIEYVRQGQMALLSLIMVALIAFSVIWAVVFIERAQRRIPVSHAQRYQARSGGGRGNHLPLKLNMSGVIPPIFASSLILFPATLAQWFGHNPEHPAPMWLTQLSYMLSQGQPLHMFLFASAILFFAFFYTALVFNPKETSDHLKKSGAFIPGIRPGEQTMNFLDTILGRLTLIGALYLVLICLLPEWLYMFLHVPFYFGGTSLLIVVVVVMDFMTQVQSLLLSQEYESLLRKANFKVSR